MSPDWSAKVEPVPYAKLGDPQSLNLYGYMLDSPLDGVDQDGHQVTPGFLTSEACAQQGNAYCQQLATEQTKIALTVAAGTALGWAGGEFAGPALEFAARVSGPAYLGLSVMGTKGAQALVSARGAVSDSLDAISTAAGSGELNLSGGTASRLGKALSSIADHFTDSDINGAIKQSITGVEAGADHVGELRLTAKSFGNLASSLKGALANPNLSGQTRSLYQNAVNALGAAIDQINKLKH